MKNLIKNFYSNNFVFKAKEKLSKLTILAIIILDIFVISTIYQGIDFQTRVINSPYVKYPSNCRDVIYSTSSVEHFNNYLYTKYNYESKYQNIKDLEVDERCNQISEKIEKIKLEIDIDSFKTRNNELYNNENSINDKIYYIKENYNTVLFEKLSEQKSNKSIIKDKLSSENIKEKYDLLLVNLEKIKEEKEELENEFKNNNLIKEFSLFLNTNKTQILEDIEKSEKYYDIKKELVILAFLIPLIMIFFYLMKRNLLNEKYILYIIYKNILILTLIPTFVSLFNLINIFIPKIFLEKLLMFFYTLEIPFIVYYLVIGIFILVFIFIIIKIQKRFREQNEKMKSNALTNIEAFNKNICVDCGNRVDYNIMNFCPCCKNQLRIDCNSCGNKRIKNLSYCYNCAENIQNN